MARTYYYQETREMKNRAPEEVWTDGNPAHEVLVMVPKDGRWLVHEKESNSYRFISEEQHEAAKREGFMFS